MLEKYIHGNAPFLHSVPIVNRCQHLLWWWRFGFVIFGETCLQEWPIVCSCIMFV